MPVPPRRRPADAGHGRHLDPGPYGRTGRLRRPAALRRRHAPDLRLDLRLRGRREHERRRLDLRPQPRSPASPTSSPRRPAAQTCPASRAPATATRRATPTASARSTSPTTARAIVVAQRVSTDAAGNRYWHPYMNIGDSTSTRRSGSGRNQRRPLRRDDRGRLLGPLHDRRPADGRRPRHAAPTSTARTSRPAATVTVTRVSTGSGAGDIDACDPVAAAGRNNWNARRRGFRRTAAARSPSPAESGVARGSGAIYFLSPEKLDGSRDARTSRTCMPRPPGAAPNFVATLEPSNAAITDAVDDSDARAFGDFQVTPSGEFAVFSSEPALTGFPTFGHTAIYRYDAGTDALDLRLLPDHRGRADRRHTALAPTGSTSPTTAASSSPRSNRSRCATPAPLRTCTSGRTGALFLISTGRSPTDNGPALGERRRSQRLLLHPRDAGRQRPQRQHDEDLHRPRRRRASSVAAVPQPCQASDECHGPGSVAPPTEVLPTFQGTGGDAKPTAKKKPKRCSRHGKKKRRCARAHRHRRTGKSRRNR